MQVMVPGGGRDVLSVARNALGLLVVKTEIRAWLKANDPKALAQAEAALIVADETILGSDERIRGLLAIAEQALEEKSRRRLGA